MNYDKVNSSLKLKNFMNKEERIFKDLERRKYKLIKK